MTGSRGRIALFLVIAVLAAAAATAASLLLLAVSDTSDEPVGKLRPRAIAVAETAPTGAGATVSPAVTREHDEDDDDREHGEDADD
ncbi:MAG: hypothetical protein IT201_01910 [Thermoleophilia bacterium]|nr:hypothetical protein [Thermoleophilia bacterium]